MKKQLEDELVNISIPYLKPDDLEDWKMKVTMLLSDYCISKEERALEVYTADETTIVIKRFLAAKLAQGLSGRTIGYYKQTLEKVFREIGKPYDKVTADDLRYYLAKRVQFDQVTKTTANNERRNLSAFYGWLQKEEILLKNPMNKIDIIKVTKKKKKAFTQMDLEKIRAACESARDTAMIEILISTWCRVSEISQIKICDIKEGSIVVHGKGDKEREVFLNAKAQLAVERYLQERKDHNPYLFPRAKYAGKMGMFARRGEAKASWYKDPELIDDELPIDKGTIETRVRKLGKKAGVENTHPHRFRRTGATMALRSGMELTVVSKILGHESIATTQIYLDISDEDMRLAHSKYVI